LIEAAPRAVLWVRDNGQGIEADLLPRLFELFAQADRSLAHWEGSLSIGLNLVPTSRDNSIDVGLPSLENAAATQRMAQHRALLVDDNIDITESSKALLEYGGHTMQATGIGREALQRALEFQSTIILLDLGCLIWAATRWRGACGNWINSQRCA
jgi:hypothetical protein